MKCWPLAFCDNSFYLWDIFLRMYICEWVMVRLDFLDVVCNQRVCQTQCSSFITVIGLSDFLFNWYMLLLFPLFFSLKINKWFVVPLIEKHHILPYCEVDIFNIYPLKRSLGLSDPMHRFWINWIFSSQGHIIMWTHFLMEIGAFSCPELYTWIETRFFPFSPSTHRPFKQW